MSGVTVYCASHHANHQLTGRDAEDLIHGLIAEFVDEAMSAEVRPGYEREFGDPVTQTYAECPLEMISYMRDGEAYAEHLEAMRESRLHVAALHRSAVTS